MNLFQLIDNGTYELPFLKDAIIERNGCNISLIELSKHLRMARKKHWSFKHNGIGFLGRMPADDRLFLFSKDWVNSLRKETKFKFYTHVVNQYPEWEKPYQLVLFINEIEPEHQELLIKYFDYSNRFEFKRKKWQMTTIKYRTGYNLFGIAG